MGYRGPDRTRDPQRGFASRVHAYMSIEDQDIASGGAFKVVQLDAEVFDGVGEWDTATYRFTPLRAGYYLIHACVRWDDEPVAWTRTLGLFDNLDVARALNTSEVGAGEDQSDQVTGLLYLTPANWINVRVWHNRGAISEIQGGEAISYVVIHRLS